MNKQFQWRIRLALLLPAAASADAKHEQVEGSDRSRIAGDRRRPVVISATQQNAANGSLAQAEIDKLDKQWRSEVKARTRA
jgi:hypothetical protein